jgi:hypothetical protein
VGEELANQIVALQQGQQPFTKMSDLLDSQNRAGMGAAAFRVLADRVTTASSVFIVRARGELENGVYQQVEAWVRRETGTGGEGPRVKVIRWREVPRWPGWDPWGWEARGG